LRLGIGNGRRSSTIAFHILDQGGDQPPDLVPDAAHELQVSLPGIGEEPLLQAVPRREGGPGDATEGDDALELAQAF
jgi:hypothetical protein